MQHIHHIQHSCDGVGVGSGAKLKYVDSVTELEYVRGSHEEVINESTNDISGGVELESMPTVVMKKSSSGEDSCEDDASGGDESEDFAGSNRAVDGGSSTAFRTTPTKWFMTRPELMTPYRHQVVALRSAFSSSGKPMSVKKIIALTRANGSIALAWEGASYRGEKHHRGHEDGTDGEEGLGVIISGGDSDELAAIQAPQRTQRRP
uniref:Uncharacterized protein n=1 Tax=Oryza barthii TaxID=65489 RepID=A0A0D3HJS3_9ORYZ